MDYDDYQKGEGDCEFKLLDKGWTQFPSCSRYKLNRSMFSSWVR